MTILSVNFNNAGQAGQLPQFIYIDTNNTVAEVTAAGFLNKQVVEGLPINESLMAVVTTRTTPSASQVQVNLFNITFSGGNWSLTANSTPLSLPNGQIFVGNAGGVAAPVSVSGAATLSNTGVLTLSAASVLLANLAPGITPSHIIKFAGKQSNGGGAASIPITVTGALSSDVVFAQVEASTNAVTVQKVTPTANTVTVLLSGDPGAGTSISYQVLRAAT